MIDLHTHVLPGIDDGCPTLEASVAMAAAAAEAGTTVLVATPHVSWQWPENDAATIAAGVDAVQRALDAAGIGVRIEKGAEVALSRALDLPDEELRALCLGDGPWLLVECPNAGDRAAVESGLNMLHVRGHRLLLAHAERCSVFHRHPDLLEQLVGDGVLCSLTASALTGRFGRTPERLARDLLARGLAHNVASDAHDVSRRPPGIREPVRAAGYEAQLGWLTEGAPGAILAGRPLPAPPEPASRTRRRWLGRTPSRR